MENSNHDGLFATVDICQLLSGINFAIDSTTDKSLCSLANDVVPLRLINVSDKPQTIYKNTCATMGQTVLDQDIIPI